jgi:transposase InsO family protein
LHPRNGALERGVGVEHDAISQLGQVHGIEDGRLTANDHVHQLRPVQAPGQGADFIGGGHGLDEQDVGPRLGEAVGAVHDRRYATRDEAKRDLFAYIEGYYNRRRLHSAIGYITPEQAELRAV